MPEIYFAPWEWYDSSDEDFPYWRAPLGTAIGCLDLRSIPEQEAENAVTPGMGLFVYTDQVNIPEGRRLASDPQQQLSGQSMRDIVNRLALPLDSGSFLQVLEQILTVGADPSGQVYGKPVSINRRSGYQVHLGGYGLVLSGRHSLDHVAFEPHRLRLVQDYKLARDHAETVREPARSQLIDALKRSTGYNMLLLFGRQGDDLIPPLVPPEYRLDGWLEPSTTITESFNKADADTLGPDLSWTELFPNDMDVDVVSNAAECIAFGANNLTVARADTDLSSDDHYSQCEITNLTPNNTHRGAIARKDSTETKTYYHVDLIGSSMDTWRTLKRVAGSFTAIGSNSTVSASAGDTIKVECDGSTIKRYRNGSEQNSTTDTAITGNKRCGLAFGGVGARLDVFEAADLDTGVVTSTQALVIS